MFLFRISIAMSTYNGASYLQEQLDIFRPQTLLPDELIICDDKLKDETLDSCFDFAHRVSFPVKLIQNKKQLVTSTNFNKAIALCTGDLIFFSEMLERFAYLFLIVMTGSYSIN